MSLFLCIFMPIIAPDEYNIFLSVTFRQPDVNQSKWSTKFQEIAYSLDH